MPQLKVQDVKDQVEALETSMNDKFTQLIEEVKSLLVNAGVSVEDVDTSKLEKEIKDLRNDLIGHVRVYNNHILQQHKKK